MSGINHRGHREHGGWTPVGEELPDEETSVIVATDDGHVDAGFLLEGKWRWLDAGTIKVAVTHWMHFPEPPEEGGR